MNNPPLLIPGPEWQTAQPVVAVMLSKAADYRVLTRSVGYPCIAPHPGTIDQTGFDLCIIDLNTLLHCEADIRKIRSRAAPALKPVLLAASESELKKANGYLGDLAEDVIRTPIRRVELTARVHNLLRLGRTSEFQKLETENTQTALKGATRALRAFSACNERVIHARSEKEMLYGICDSLAKDGGYALAWVGQAKAYGGGRIKPLAIAGGASDYINKIENSPRTSTAGQDPIALALQTGIRHQSIVPASPGEAAIPEKSEKSHHLQSVIAFPLTIRDKQPEACLAIYSVEADRFDGAEVRLLQRMVDNIVHGIRALREQSRRRRSEKKAHDMAYRDALTGLANRTAALEALDRHLRLAGPFPPAAGLLYLDLDGFKLINDALGHDAGDEVLIQVAQRLTHAVRESDLVARQGGDEFIILAPYEAQDCLSTVDLPELMSVMSAVAQRVLETIEQPFVVRGREYYLGASIGISLCPVHSCDASTLLTSADSAMYQAKNVGGNSFQFFSCDLSKKQQHRLDIENRLRTAVDMGEFQLAFQPLIDLTTTRTVGVEALIRWPQADGSYISPGEFIPIAEETSLIIRIGTWVMKEALKALQRLHLQGFTHLQMAVNLAIGQLWQPGLVQDIVDFLKQLDIPPSALKVELTEGSLMSDVQRMEGIVQEFRRAEIEVAIDDFGTGYSSLARLRSLPITTLKIDRSFLFGTPDNQSAVKMVNTIRQMAESLGIQALAEGIETEEQWRMLQALGCPLGQGFYFAKPMAETALLERLSAEI
ncbi:bifunctional diguanylate cyclase/phosphodiesterase [Marinobacter subterrani]|nr:EAL domain-containing protein [Marinobacter subterrani]